MALTLEITAWNLIPLNPDGTTDTLLPTITAGTVPTSEIINFGAMGKRFRLELEVTAGVGPYPDTSVEKLPNSIVKYNPGMFVERYSALPAFPAGGYSYGFGPVATPGTYQMQLTGVGDLATVNQNGVVAIQVIDDNHFVIKHSFRQLSDIENYVVGKNIDNQYRVSKASQYSLGEASIQRPSVYGGNKALNAAVQIKNTGQTAITSHELSIPWQSSFADFKDDGDPSDLDVKWIYERLSDPGTELTDISPFEDNKVTIEIDDPDEVVVIDEVQVILTERALKQNISSYEKDLNLQEAKLVTTGSSANISGPFYGPVVYTRALGKTRVSFTVKGQDLRTDIKYQVAALIPYDSDSSPSAELLLTQHTMTDFQSNGTPQKVEMDVTAEIWSRNGLHGNNMNARVNERLTAVFSMNSAQYDASDSEPWTTFDADISRVIVRQYEVDGLSYQVWGIGKNDDGTWTDTDRMGHKKIGDIHYFYLKEWRVGYDNEQGLEDWNGTTRHYEWNALFIDPATASSFPDTFQMYIFASSYLTIDGYEMDEGPSPSDSPLIDNIRFLDPETGLPLSSWEGLTMVRIVADVDDLGATTYVAGMVDKFPYGAQMFNDQNLVEEDPMAHATPSYVIFEQKHTTRIISMPTVPIGGTVTFDVDISDMNGDEQFRIFIQSYRA